MKRLTTIVCFILCSLILISCKHVGYYNVTKTPTKNNTTTKDIQSADITKISSKINKKQNNITDYSIINKKFKRNGITIKYPYIKGLNNKKKQDNINELLKNEAMISFNSYVDDSSDFDLNIDYDITWMSNNLLSVKYEGFVYGKTAAYPTSLLYTVNIDMNHGRKIALAGYINISKSFIEKILNYRVPEESITNYALEYLQKHISYGSSLNDFRKADCDYDNQPYIFSYFSKDSLGISMQVLHQFGDYIDIKIKYSELKNYISKNSPAWKEFNEYFQ